MVTEVKKKIVLETVFTFKGLKGFMKSVTAPQPAIRTLGNKMGLLRRDMLDVMSPAARLGARFRTLLVGMRGFRMEMLGVLFFGMALKRFFLGLLNPALQVSGVFEILQFTLQALFLPTVLNLLDPLLALSSWFINIDPDIQNIIALFALFGVGLGSVLETVGALALGLGSLAIAFGGLTVTSAEGAISRVGIAGLAANSALLTLLGTIGKFIGIGIAIGVVLDIFGNVDTPMTKTSLITHLFGGALAGLLIGGIPGALVGFSMALLVELEAESARKFRLDLIDLLTPDAFKLPINTFFGAGGLKGQGTTVPNEARFPLDLNRTTDVIIHFDADVDGVLVVDNLG